MLRPFNHQKRILFSWTLYPMSFLMVSILGFSPLFAQQPLQVEFNLFNLPSCRQALIALNAPAFATFEKRPLGVCLTTLADAYRVSVWIDRRVDTSRLVTIVGVGANESPDSKTTLGRLVTVARLVGADAGLVENIVYVGPADQIGPVQRAAARLHDEIMRSRKARGQQVELRKLSWEDITTPTELLENMQKLWSIKIASKLPHDLMHAGGLPSSTLASQLTLLHAGFGRQVECDSQGAFTANPLVQDSVWSTSYADKELQTDRLTAARQEFPTASLQVTGKVSTVTGPTAFHLRLLAIRTPNARVPNPRTAEDKFVIPEFRAPLERIVGDLAKNLGMQVNWSSDIPESKRQAVVTFGVPKKKTVDEILKQIADEFGIKILRQGQTIEVLP
jgi:hypothetical protein